MITISFFAVLAIISSILYSKKEKVVFKTLKRVFLGAVGGTHTRSALGY